jgi:hypothetical protein
MLELYESASPEARAMLDKIGGDTMEGFNAWATQGLGERGRRAVEWANMVANLPMVGGRREVDLDGPQAQARSRLFEKGDREFAEKAGVDYDEWKNMTSMERRRAAVLKSKQEGLKKYGIPQVTDFMLDSFGMLPGMAIPAKIAKRAVTLLPGMTGYKGKSVGETFKDFAKEDLPGIAFDVAKSLVPGAQNIPLPRIPGLGRGVPVVKNEKPYQLMSVEERQEQPFRDMVRRQDMATKARADQFKAENARRSNFGDDFGFMLANQTSANPKNNFDFSALTDEEIASMKPWEYEQKQADYESGQRGKQARERPDLKQGTRAQKQDLELRQMRAQQDTQLEGALNQRQKALSDSANMEAFYAKQRKSKGKGAGCDACGSAAPSAGFLRKVLGKYKTMRGGMEKSTAEKVAPYIPVRHPVPDVPAPLDGAEHYAQHAKGLAKYAEEVRMAKDKMAMVEGIRDVMMEIYTDVRGRTPKAEASMGVPMELVIKELTEDMEGEKFSKADWRRFLESA